MTTMFGLYKLVVALPNKGSIINSQATKYLLTNFSINKTCLSTPVRTISVSNLKFQTQKTNADANYKVIYKGPLTPQIRAVKLFSLTSSIIGLCAQPIIIREANTIGSVPLIVALCGVVGFFTFVTPLLLHFITKKYVIEVEYNAKNDTYIATTISFLLARKELEFKSEDVVVPDIPGMFTTFLVKGTPLFVEIRHFDEPIHYARLMGFDKPMDFKLGTVDSEDQTPKQH